VTRATLILIVAVSTAVMHSERIGNIVVDNVAVDKGNDQWEWTIFVKSSPDVLNSIEYVQYTLHPTFADPIQKVYKTSNPDYPFGLTRTGWGVFEVPVRVVFKNGEQRTLKYLLRFHQAAQGSKCRVPFLVNQRHYLHIEDGGFKSEIYIYVGEIHQDRKKPFHSTVFVGSQNAWGKEGGLKQPEFESKMKRIAENYRWSSKLRDIGDSVAFQDAGRPYHLEVVNVTFAPSEARRVTLRVCEY